MESIYRLLRPRSVAVIGASADPTKIAARPVAYLRKHGYAGAIYPVNPKADAIGDLRCYPDIASLPETPDVAIVLLGAAAWIRWDAMQHRDADGKARYFWMERTPPPAPAAPAAEAPKT